MNSDCKYILSFSDFRTILDFINEIYRIDLSIYTIGITKHRIEIFLAQYNIIDLENAKRLFIKEKLWQSFYNSLFIETTEMFRDVEVWTKFKEKYLSKINYTGDFKVLIPDATSDDELFTIIVVLKEAGINNYKILATSSNPNNFSRITNNNISQKKLETSIQNFRVYDPNSDLEKYFENANYGLCFKKDLLKNVDFKEMNVIDQCPTVEPFDLILYRNRLLYYNSLYHTKIIENISNCLSNSGVLMLGVKEQIQMPLQFKLTEVDKDFKFYKKK